MLGTSLGEGVVITGGSSKIAGVIKFSGSSTDNSLPLNIFQNVNKSVIIIIVIKLNILCSSILSFP